MLVLQLPTALVFVVLEVHISFRWVCELFPNEKVVTGKVVTGKVVTGTEVCEVLVQMQFNPFSMAVGQLDMSMN